MKRYQKIILFFVVFFAIPSFSFAFSSVYSPHIFEDTSAGLPQQTTGQDQCTFYGKTPNVDYLTTTVYRWNDIVNPSTAGTSTADAYSTSQYSYCNYSPYYSGTPALIHYNSWGEYVNINGLPAGSYTFLIYVSGESSQRYFHVYKTTPAGTPTGYQGESSAIYGDSIEIQSPIMDEIFSTSTIPLSIYYNNFSSWKFMQVDVTVYGAENSNLYYQLYYDIVDMSSLAISGYVSGTLGMGVLPTSTSWVLTAVFSNSSTSQSVNAPYDYVYFHYGQSSNLYYDQQQETYEDVECSYDNLFGCFKKSAMYLFIPAPSSIRQFSDLEPTDKVPFGYAYELISGVNALLSAYSTASSTDISFTVDTINGATTTFVLLDKDIVSTYTLLQTIRSLVSAGIIVMSLMYIYRRTLKLFNPSNV